MHNDNKMDKIVERFPFSNTELLKKNKIIKDMRDNVDRDNEELLIRY